MNGTTDDDPIIDADEVKKEADDMDRTKEHEEKKEHDPKAQPKPQQPPPQQPPQEKKP